MTPPPPLPTPPPRKKKRRKKTTIKYSDTVLYISLFSGVTPATSQLMEFLSVDGQIWCQNLVTPAGMENSYVRI